MNTKLYDKIEKLLDKTFLVNEAENEAYCDLADYDLMLVKLYNIVKNNK